MRRIRSFIVFLLITMAVSGWVHAAVIQVTSTEDRVPGSLRAALTLANTNGEDNTIYLPAGAYILRKAPVEDPNPGSCLVIETAKSLTIIGDGSESTIIDGNKTGRVFEVYHGGKVSISHVTIQNGKAGDGETRREIGQHGGGIYNEGDLSLHDCIIRDNESEKGFERPYHSRRCSRSGGHGGGIYNGGSLYLTRCIVTGNSSGDAGTMYSFCFKKTYGGFGGGIYNDKYGEMFLNDCTISHNKSGSGLSDGGKYDMCHPGGHGGGIYNAGEQRLNNCIIEYNTTGHAGYGNKDLPCKYPLKFRSGYGGGIYNRRTSILNGCIIQFNCPGSIPGEPEFEGRGGGIYNIGGIHLYDCTIRKNHSTGSRWSMGGGLCNEEDPENEYSDGTATLTRCTISGNYTSNGSSGWNNGGGIYSEYRLTLTNCTIAGNYAGNGGSGGGIFCSGGTLTNCTVYNNRAGKGVKKEDISPGSGGGIYTSHSIRMKNTILAHNQVYPGGEGPDCYGELSSDGYNLMTKSAGCTITGTLAGNKIGVDPKLAPLADNGGPTWTCALLEGSPAIDKGNSRGIYEDQRGRPRPFDVPGIRNLYNGADIGAYEYCIIPSISGKITCYGSPLANTRITCSNNGGTMTTDQMGNYSFAVSYLWSGEIMPSCPGYTFTPASRVYSGVSEDQTGQNYAALPAVPGQLSLNRTQLNFAAKEGGASTAPQHFSIFNSGGFVLNCTVSSNAAWLICLPAAVSGAGTVTVTVAPSGLAPGTYAGAITVADPHAANSPQVVNATLTVYDAGSVNPPFGSFDTPIDDSRAAGSIPVTGWALDAVGLQSVKIYRDPIQGEGSEGIYIADATFVEGARPDIETAYPDYPGHYKAGWGYMLLTYFLPNQGNGAFTIYAKAINVQGDVVTLGMKTIGCENADSVKPFGAIDTPGEGETISGDKYVNFGWVLTPQPNTIPVDGSTIIVWVDGVPLGHPVYNQYRKDIASLFPGYNNSNGAVGYYYLNTGAYENGVHTISWSVEDDAGNKQGIGSRYFTILDPGQGDRASALTGRRLSSGEALAARPSSLEPVRVKKGFDDDAQWEAVYPGNEGIVYIESRELERIAINLNGFADFGCSSRQSGNSTAADCYAGYSVVDDRLGELPIGATLDGCEGIFYWQPGAGFVGKYRFVFIKQEKNGVSERKDIIVTIGPGG